MNSIETVGFALSILLSLYLVLEVRERRNASLQNFNEEPNANKSIQSQENKAEDGGLTRLQGHRVGHVQTIDVGNERKLNLITRALRPLTFEIPNFLNDTEIEYMLSKAKNQSLFISDGVPVADNDFISVGDKGRMRANEEIDDFLFWDTNKDWYIDLKELRSGVMKVNPFVTPNEDELKKGFLKIFPAEMDDGLYDFGLITEIEWAGMDTINIEEKIRHWFTHDPRFRARYSEQTWLSWEKEGVLAAVRQRVVNLTKLPKEVVHGGEAIQIAHYHPGGHYHAHYDSETHQRSELPCCHQYEGEALDFSNCILCRLITILTYMNDVEDGGETAFVYADNRTLTNVNVDDKLNLSQRCKDANLVIKPRKGTAVFWYNHYVDLESNYLGTRDDFSLHGGCDVIKGEKWISNIWLTAPYERHKHLPSLYL